MKIVDVSVDRPVLMTMVIMAAVVMGLFALKDLAVDLLPDVEFPIVTVRTIYPGTGPKEIESLITEKIEDAVSSISGIDRVQSTSLEGVSVVIVQFVIGTNVDVAASDVKDKVDEIKINLPDGAEDPTVLKLDINAQPIITMSVSGERPLQEIYKITDDVVAEELSRVDGVASVDIVGGKEREILVAIEQRKLDAYNLTLGQVIQALAGGNLNLPGGRIKEQRQEYTVRLSGEYGTVDDIDEVEIPIPGMAPIRLKDVAQVIDTFKEQRELVRLNGKNAVGLSILKKSDANIVEVAHALKSRLELLKSRVPGDIKMEVMLDRSMFIESSIQDLVSNMVLGALLTALVLYLFLHSIRGVIIAGVSIPTSIVATFNLIRYAGFTINFMSLMALAISVGILVTNAIVVLENVQRHIQHNDDPVTSSKVGTTEIAIAVLASTLTNIVVFTPIALMKGIIGQFFIQFGLTVTFATIFSLLTAFTLTPMLSARLLKRVEREDTFLARVSQRFEAFYDSLAMSYRHAVQGILRRRVITLGVIFVLFFGIIIGLGRYMGFGFFAESDQGYFSIKVEMPPGDNLAETNKALLRVEQILEKHQKDLKKTYTVLGKISGGILGATNEGVEVGEITVDIGDKEDRDFTVKEFYESLRKELALGVPAANITLQAISPGGGGADAPIQLQITGTDLDKLVEMSAESERIMRSMPNVVDVKSTWHSGKPEVQVVPRRKLITDYGLSVTQVAMAIRYGIEGQVATQYRVGDDEYDIRVRFNDQDKNNLENLSSISFLTSAGKVPLSALCDIESGTGPTQINRRNKKRMITLTAGIGYGALGNVVADISQRLSQLKWPLGYGFQFAGQEESRQESVGEIGQALLVAIILTYMLLAATLESYIEPLMIMSTVPLGLIGVILALVMTNKPLDIFAMMAIVMLVGIVVNNAILIIDYIHTLRSHGLDLLEAVLTSCQTRLRPIIMTNTAVVLGMLPLALGIGKGAEMRAPMAIVSIGGIISSTIFTLFLLPVLYYSYQHWQTKRLAQKTLA